MGVSRSVVIAVGLPQEEINNFSEVEEYLTDECNMDSIPYYYDCCETDQIFGIEIKATGGWLEIDLDQLQALIDLSKEHFKQATGQEAKVYISRKEC